MRFALDVARAMFTIAVYELMRDGLRRWQEHRLRRAVTPKGMRLVSFKRDVRPRYDVVVEREEDS